ncbi:MAG: hypothetical protein IK149_01705 [Oscillospiraceae bacterium]|nr:hypothetical protein [Oscillospiraceae bacterium]
MDEFKVSEQKMLQTAGLRPQQDEEPQRPKIEKERLIKWMDTLQRYKTGKASLENRVIASENWWKMRNDIEEAKETEGNRADFKAKSGWLHNVIVSKHADLMEAYPEPNILPREPNDSDHARMLTAIVPCILEQCKFERCWSDNGWQKLKSGTAVYKVTWDADKLNGLGDVSIERVNLLNLFWEPGITDIQTSRHLFYTYLEDKEELRSRYPELKDEALSNGFEASKFLYDDHVPTEDMVTVVDHYYHLYRNGKRELHFCKFVGETALDSTEEKGEPLYDHGRYPFVLDPLYPVEGSPAGYGFVDLARNAQTQIDLMRTAILKNAMVGATPRYFIREDGQVNEEEFLDLGKPLVHVRGSLEDTSLRAISYTQLSGNYINYLSDVINELRQVTGNTETATGSTTAGATAASAIAALQEASGKGSRDSTRGSYRAYSDIVELVIELVRQFYDQPRRFRITGEMGADDFVSFSNNGIKPQDQGSFGGQELGPRLPVFDIKIEPQKRNAYTRMSQNELALQFYNAGFFQPENAETAMTTLGMMEFEGKDAIMQKIAQNQTMQQQLQQFQQFALMLAKQYRPDLVEGLMQSMGMQQQAPQGSAPMQAPPEEITGGEPKHMRQAREQAAAASQPQG